MPVSDLFPLFDSIAGNRSDNIGPEQKAALLNAAKTEFWKIMTGWQVQANWFVVQSQNSSSGDPDYFGPIDTAQREYNLPTNFHHLRAINLVPPEPTGVVFERSSIDNQHFAQQRQLSLGNTTPRSTIMYDIVGANPGQMVFAAYPTKPLNVVLWYVKKPDAWSSPQASIAEFPEESHIMICEWAAKRLLLGLTDAKWAEFATQWDREVSRWAMLIGRDSTGPNIVRGFTGLGTE